MDVKWKVINHVHIASTSLDEEMFASTSDEAHNNPLCKSVMDGSRKQGKLKWGREEFAW
jgi:hypothetical protein